MDGRAVGWTAYKHAVSVNVSIPDPHDLRCVCLLVEFSVAL